MEQSEPGIRPPGCLFLHLHSCPSLTSIDILDADVKFPVGQPCVTRQPRERQMNDKHAGHSDQHIEADLAQAAICLAHADLAVLVLVEECS